MKPEIVVPMLLLAAACVHDCRERRIPNRLTVWGLASGWLYHLAAGGPGALWMGVLGAAAGFGLLWLPHRFGKMGAGDVKLMMAAGAWTGPWAALHAFPWIVIIGGAMGAVLMARRDGWRETGLKVAYWIRHLRSSLVLEPEAVSGGVRVSLPYGVPIALGFLAYFSVGGILQ